MAVNYNSGFITEYRKKKLDELKLIYPNVSTDKLLEFINKTIDKNLKTEMVVIDNNYSGKKFKADTLKLYDWLKKKKPITTEHGVLFHNQNEALNLNAEMLKHILATRKSYKKKMFEAKATGDNEKAKYYDNRQKIYKIFANSYYGASGQAQSIFYNLHVALSITGKGQAIISTAMTAFEKFLYNNIEFDSIDDLLKLIYSVEQEYKEKNFNDEKILDKEIDIDTLTNYLVGKFKNKQRGKLYKSFIYNVLQNNDPKYYSRIYYKNNLLKFVENKYVLNLFKDIFNSVEEFKNPNEIPEVIKDKLEYLWKLIKEYVLYNYAVVDRIKKLKTIKRQAVLTVDTDSNLLNLEPVFNFFNDRIDTISESNEEDVFKVINTITFILSKVIAEVYYLYTTQCGIIEEYKPVINMKNEFLMKRLLLTQNKKNYASTILLQEGVKLNPPKFDIKGLSINKVNVNKHVGEYFQNILENDILNSEKISISEILKKIETFENTMRESLSSGSTKYLIPSKANDIDSYVNPFTQSPIRAALIWNLYYPDNEISFPAQFNMVKLNLLTLEDCEGLKSNKKVYDIIKNKVFNPKDEEFGKYNNPTNKDGKSYSYGISYFAIPKSEENIPEWLIPYIDIDTMVKDAINNFLVILNSIGIKNICVLANDLYYSNILEF